MWKDEVLQWESTVHLWNELGYEIDNPNQDLTDPMHAKLLVTWKQQSLGGLVKGVFRSIRSSLQMSDAIEANEMLAGFIVTLLAINLFPLNLKLIEDDESAVKYLSLLHEAEDGTQYFLKNELQSEVEIEPIITYFVKNHLLKEQEGRLIVQGRVLNRAHLKR